MLSLYRISLEAIENSVSILVKGNPQNIGEMLRVLLYEYQISKVAIEKALYTVSRGNPERARKVFSILHEYKIENNTIEGCLSVLVFGDSNEIENTLKTLVENGVDRVIINNSLYAIAIAKSSEIYDIFDKFQKHGLVGANVLKNGLSLFVKGKADDIEKIILTLQNNGVRNEIIEKELSAIANSCTPEEVEEMFSDNIEREPKNRNKHYLNIRRYMILKELNGRIYNKEEIESLCAQKRITVREFISEIVTYPRGRDFTDIYYKKLEAGGTLYVGGATEIDRDYQEKHGEELVQLSMRIASRFARITAYNDCAELQSMALEIILTKCGNLTYNLSHDIESLRAAMINKTIRYLYSAIEKRDINSLTNYGNVDNYIGQIDIPVADNVQTFEDEGLASSIDYKKAKFSEIETQVMQCMVRLVEERRSG